METERNLALLLGLHSFSLIRGQPLNATEQLVTPLLRSEVMASGLLASHSIQKIATLPADDIIAWYQSQVSCCDGGDAQHRFAYNLAEGGKESGSLAMVFQVAVDRYDQVNCLTAVTMG